MKPRLNTTNEEERNYNMTIYTINNLLKNFNDVTGVSDDELITDITPLDEQNTLKINFKNDVGVVFQYFSDTNWSLETLEHFESKTVQKNDAIFEFVNFDDFKCSTEQITLTINDINGITPLSRLKSFIESNSLVTHITFKRDEPVFVHDITKNVYYKVLKHREVGI
jgi:hypothetical protein